MFFSFFLDMATDAFTCMLSQFNAKFQNKTHLLCQLGLEWYNTFHYQKQCTNIIFTRLGKKKNIRKEAGDSMLYILPLHCQFLQMFYKHLQTDIISKYDIFIIHMHRLLSQRWV